MQERNDNRYMQSWLICMWTLIIVVVSVVIMMDRFETLDSNQRDIDRRLTNLEQGMNETDTALMHLYQNVNEYMFYGDKK